jgi:hypothetical protein
MYPSSKVPQGIFSFPEEACPLFPPGGSYTLEYYSLLHMSYIYRRRDYRSWEEEEEEEFLPSASFSGPRRQGPTNDQSLDSSIAIHPPPPFPPSIHIHPPPPPPIHRLHVKLPNGTQPQGKALRSQKFSPVPVHGAHARTHARAPLGASDRILLRSV